MTWDIGRIHFQYRNWSHDKQFITDFEHWHFSRHIVTNCCRSPLPSFLRGLFYPVWNHGLTSFRRMPGYQVWYTIVRMTFSSGKISELFYSVRFFRTHILGAFRLCGSWNSSSFFHQFLIYRGHEPGFRFKFGTFMFSDNWQAGRQASQWIQISSSAFQVFKYSAYKNFPRKRKTI